MTMFRKVVRKTLNVPLRLGGFELQRRGETGSTKSYIPFRETIRDAAKAGVPVGDYIDAKHQVPGATQATIDQLTELGVLGEKIHSVCEIGPGSGRYLEKVQRLCTPCSYEIYETDKEWSDWLTHTYQVTARDADGTSLRRTVSGSMDLVHAHKVFVCLPTIVTCGYFNEMIRVARRGASIVFDIVSELCMDEAMVEKWIASAIYYPSLLPRDFVINFFARRQCVLRASFFATMRPGKSEYLVFVKDGA
jgi:hypothetical protein